MKTLLHTTINNKQTALLPITTVSPMTTSTISPQTSSLSKTKVGQGLGDIATAFNSLVVLLWFVSKIVNLCKILPPAIVSDIRTIQWIHHKCPFTKQFGRRTFTNIVTVSSYTENVVFGSRIELWLKIVEAAHPIPCTASSKNRQAPGKRYWTPIQLLSFFAVYPQFQSRSTHFFAW